MKLVPDAIEKIEFGIIEDKATSSAISPVQREIIEIDENPNKDDIFIKKRRSTRMKKVNVIESSDSEDNDEETLESLKEKIKKKLIGAKKIKIEKE